MFLWSVTTKAAWGQRILIRDSDTFPGSAIYNLWHLRKIMFFSRDLVPSSKAGNNICLSVAKNSNYLIFIIPFPGFFFIANIQWFYFTHFLPSRSPTKMEALWRKRFSFFGSLCILQSPEQSLAHYRDTIHCCWGMNVHCPRCRAIVWIR